MRLLSLPAAIRELSPRYSCRVVYDRHCSQSRRYDWILGQHDRCGAKPRRVYHGRLNTFGTMPGIIGNLVTGAILQVTGSWNLVFAVAALVLVFSATFFHCCASDESIYAQLSYGEGYNGSSATSNSFSGSLDCSLSLSSIPDEEENLLENQI